MTTATRHRARLGDLLVAHGAITDEQLAQALEVQQAGHQDRLLGEILVDLGATTHEQVLGAVAEACGVPFVRLGPHLLDPAVQNALPEPFMQKHGVLPLFRVRDLLTVAVSEPANLFLVDEIAHVAGLNVQIAAATAENIFQMMNEVRLAGTAGEEPGDDLAAVLPSVGDPLLPDDYESVYGDWPAERVAGLLIREAVRSRASAIHLEPDEKVLRIRFRTDGVLHVVMRPPARLVVALANAFEAMLTRSGAAADGPMQGTARLMVHGRAVQMHVTSLRGAFGPRTVVYLVRDDEAQKPLEKLGCDFELLSAYRDLLGEGRGLMLVAGPRESGITTTLYSTLNSLDLVRLNICTLESRVNFSLPGVNQFSPATCGLADPAQIMSRLLLQQPDVLALDTVMDRAVAAMAVEAALEGRRVIAQVRAADAAEAIVQLGAFVPHDHLASSLRGVLAQRLVRTVCLHCRVPDDVPVAVRRRIAEVFGPVDDYIRGRGCVNCGQTGFLGQIGLFELVPVAGGLARLIQSGAPAAALREVIHAAGRPSLWADGVNKVRAGITSIGEVRDVLTGYPGGAAEGLAPALAEHGPTHAVSRN